MKTDRRHALQTNWLADHLGRWLEKIKPYTNYLITGVFVLVAGLTIWLVVAHYWQNGEDVVWQQLSGYAARVNRRIDQETGGLIKDLQKKQDELQNLPRPPTGDKPAEQEHEKRVQELQQQIGDLRRQLQNKQTEILDGAQEELYRTAKENIRMVAGRAVAFFAAKKDFDEAADSVLSDPIGARNKLDRAAELLELIRENTRDKLLKQRADFQLARVYETRLRQDDQHRERDDIQLARGLYEELATQVPDSYCKAEAERRLAALQPKSASNQDPKDPVYGWVSGEIEKRKASPLPLGSGSPGLFGNQPPPDLN
jgi:hypothetical protein